MDKLLLIPILVVTAYFMYRYIRNIIKDDGECGGSCASCSLEMQKKVHGKSSVTECK